MPCRGAECNAAEPHSQAPERRHPDLPQVFTRSKFLGSTHGLANDALGLAWPFFAWPAALAERAPTLWFRSMGYAAGISCLVKPHVSAAKWGNPQSQNAKKALRYEPGAADKRKEEGIANKRQSAYPIVCSTRDSRPKQKKILVDNTE